MILKNIMSLLERGLSIIVMVQRKEHGIKLLEGLNIENSLCVYGGRYGYIMENNQAVPISINYDVFRKDFNEGNYKVAIISQVGDEGLNLPNCNAMILAGGGKSRIKVLQRLGRVIRRKDRALNHSYIIDFIDNTHVYLRSQSYSRKKIYEEEGCIICKDRYSFINTIYKDFKDV